MTVSNEAKIAALAIASGDPSDVDPIVKRELAAAVATIYEALRDFPSEVQARVLTSAAVLLGRADDIVDRLTGKVRS
jgi:hypothetical protein